jgi:hypothetical protein
MNSSLLLHMDLEKLLLRARTILDGVNHLDGDEERERAEVVNELDTLLHALAGIETKGKPGG